MIKCKCRGCEKRSRCCHDHCEDYKAYRAEIDKRNEYERAKIKQEQDEINRIKFNMAILPREDRTNVAYIANRFIDPNVLKFFMDKGIEIDCDHFALSEMLQFIWRSAIRDDMPITVYIPSKRMRDLFIKWIDERSIGG